jgi:hypothetical protein
MVVTSALTIKTTTWTTVTVPKCLKVDGGFEVVWIVTSMATTCCKENTLGFLVPEFTGTILKAIIIP